MSTPVRSTGRAFVNTATRSFSYGLGPIKATVPPSCNSSASLAARFAVTCARTRPPNTGWLFLGAEDVVGLPIPPTLHLKYPETCSPLSVRSSCTYGIIARNREIALSLPPSAARSLLAGSRIADDWKRAASFPLPSLRLLEATPMARH
jgi:hypothetical protein